MAAVCHQGGGKMLYGYARVSTPKQKLERQIRNIKELYPEAIVITDEYTGTTIARPNWTKLYRHLQAGDIVVFDSVSRMSRNADEGFALYQELYNKGIELIFIKERHIDTATYKNTLNNSVRMTGTNVDYILEGLNKYLMALAKEQIKLAFDQAEKEVMDLRQRTKEGIAIARLKGEQIGQKKGNRLHIKKEEPAKEKIIKYSNSFEGNLNDAECIKLCDISRNTYYKYKRELKQKYS